ncbi:DUF3667 domain-containing protein [Christiangramia sp. SM2212]|uniref:DUF3667 domain-containing protein n=1 Tax=Christiangramia sediminicola TaxID=3073267 RepID=A0ABU1EMI3_9FLAO|nr:DUF3667 domain-containing protein [Christiangramia sp. SM2212]MDR5589595.1 DUF3667 domain-containing protein [Christiangramia sp. SM2212]
MFCKNCKNELSNDQSYCPNCGAKIIGNRLTINYLSSEFFESFWRIDSNKPVLTFVDLFRKPVNVIDGYINGLRKKYINPFGYFTIALTLTGIYTFINLNYFPEYLDNGAFQANIEEQDISRELTTRILEHMNLLFFLFVPIITLFSRLIFLKNKKYNLAEHLIIHLYTYAHIHIITSVLIMISFISESSFRLMNFISIPIYVIYYSYVFKGLYDMSWWKTFLKTLLFLLIFGVFFLGIATAMLMVYLKYFSELELN